MHAPTDFAHAREVERILREHRMGSAQTGSEEWTHRGAGLLWGRRPVPAVGQRSLRAMCPHPGGC